MKPIRLEFQAFLSYKNNTVIDFTNLENSIFLIDGDTGAGKTTIFDAMCYALYGEASDSARGSNFKSDYADKDTESFVKFTFEEQGEVYQVTRYPAYNRDKKRKGKEEGDIREPEKTELLLPDNKTLIKIKEVNAKIIEIVKLKVEQFRNTIMIGQNKFAELIRSDTKTRKSLFQEILKTQKFGEFQGKLKELCDKATQEVKDANTKIDVELKGYKTDNEELSAKLSKGNPSDNDFDILSNLISLDLKELENKLDEQKANKGIEDKKLKDLNVQLSKVKENNDHYNSFNDHDSKLKELEKQKDKNDDLGKTIDSYDDSKKSYDKYKDYLDKKDLLNEKEKKLNEKETELKDFSSDFETAKNNNDKVDGLEQSNISLRKEIGDLEKLLEDFNSLEKEKDAKKDNKQLIETNSKTLAGLETKQKTISEKLEKLNEFNKTNKEANVKLNEIKNNLDGIEKEIDELKKYNEKFKSLLEDEENLNIKESEIQKLSEEALLKERIYNELNMVYKNSMAGILASNLKEGDPCPVCGAIHHTKLAKKAKEDISDEKVETALNEKDAAEKKHDKALIEFKAKKDSLDESLEDLFKEGQSLFNVVVNKDNLEGLIEDKEKQLLELKANKISEKEKLEEISKQMKENEEEIVELEEVKDSNKKNIDGIKNSLATISGTLEKVDERIKDLSAKLNGQNKEQLETNIKSREKTIGSNKKLIGDYQKAYSEANDKKTGLNQSIKDLKEEIKKLTPNVNKLEAEYKDLVLKTKLKDIDKIVELIEKNIDTIDSIKGKLNSYKSELKLQQGLYDSDIKNGYDKLVLMDEKEANENVDKQQIVVNELDEKFGELKTKYSNNTTRFDSYKNLNKTIKDKNNNVSDLQNLSDVASGKVNGKEKLDFETYYQSQIFDNILQQANNRLNIMTDGVYSMQRHDSSEDKSNSALDIDIFDTNTGKIRSANSLSGGEIFMASLSLALGFSEISRTKSGAHELDCMFIDEGFGTLDDETLKVVMKVLNQLSQEANRTIGIISHVSELRDVISKQIHVTKDKFNGSTLKMIV